MFDRRFRLAATFVAVLAGISVSQRSYGAEQSPRQAMIEMRLGRRSSFQKTSDLGYAEPASEFNEGLSR